MNNKNIGSWHVTTLRIPSELASYIKKNGMTYSGAFRRGVECIEQVKRLQEENRGMQENIRKYQLSLQTAHRQIEELKDKLGIVDDPAPQ